MGLGREVAISLDGVRDKNMMQLKKLNVALFPIRYNDKYYADAITSGEFSKLGIYMYSPKSRFFFLSLLTLSIFIIIILKWLSFFSFFFAPWIDWWIFEVWIWFTGFMGIISSLLLLYILLPSWIVVLFIEWKFHGVDSFYVESLRGFIIMSIKSPLFFINLWCCVARAFHLGWYIMYGKIPGFINLDVGNFFFKGSWEACLM